MEMCLEQLDKMVAAMLMHRLYAILQIAHAVEIHMLVARVLDQLAKQAKQNNFRSAAPAHPRTPPHTHAHTQARAHTHHPKPPTPTRAPPPAPAAGQQEGRGAAEVPPAVHPARRAAALPRLRAPAGEERVQAYRGELGVYGNSSPGLQRL